MFYESEEYIEIWRLQPFFGQDKRLEMSLQYTHAEVNVQLQSRVDALEAVEDACTLAEAWHGKRCLKLCSIFLGAKWMVPLIQR